MNGYAVHLDFQIRINDQPTDPMKFFKKNDDPGTIIWWFSYYDE